jgi:hypothetical protein
MLAFSRQVFKAGLLLTDGALPDTKIPGRVMD